MPGSIQSISTASVVSLGRSTDPGEAAASSPLKDQFEEALKRLSQLPGTDPVRQEVVELIETSTSKLIASSDPADEAKRASLVDFAQKLAYQYEGKPGINEDSLSDMMLNLLNTLKAGAGHG